MMLKIDVKNIGNAVQTLKRVASHVDEGARTTGNVLSSGVSSIGGVSEAGEIHGRLLLGDPGSAEQVLGDLSARVAWMGSLYASSVYLVYMQDELTSIGLQASALGLVGASETKHLEDDPGMGDAHVGFAPPVVELGGSIEDVAAEVGAIDIAQMVESSHRWAGLSELALDTANQLELVAGEVAGGNSGQLVDASVARVREAAELARVFAGNAKEMSGRTKVFAGFTASARITSAVQAAAVGAIVEPTARESASAAAVELTRMQLQQAVDASLPMPGQLTQVLESGSRTTTNNAGGGVVEVGLPGTGGGFGGLTVDEVEWPQPLVEAAARGEVGPGSFAVVDGKIQNVSGVGLDDAQTDQFRNVAQRQVADLVQQAGIKPEDFVTQPAGFNPEPTLPAHTLNPTGLNTTGLNPAGLNPTGLGTNSLNPGTGIGNGTAINAGTGASLGTGMGAGVSSGAGTGIGAGTGSTGGGLPIGAASGGAQRVLGSSVLPGGRVISGSGIGSVLNPSMGTGVSPEYAAGHGMNQAAGQGTGQGYNHGGNQGGSQGYNQGTGQGYNHGGNQGVGQGYNHGMNQGYNQGYNQGAASTHAVGSGAKRREEPRGRIASVTTQVETDPNRRALLGDLPPAIPGVIGAWVRED